LVNTPYIENHAKISENKISNSSVPNVLHCYVLLDIKLPIQIDLLLL